jgi:hypothetical protein
MSVTVSCVMNAFYSDVNRLLAACGGPDASSITPILRDVGNIEAAKWLSFFEDG